VKEAFLWFEIEVMELGYLEDVMNCAMVVVEGSTSGDTNVIHIDADRCSKGFVFKNNIPIDVVHHGLEHRWGVGKLEVHDRGFEKSISGFKGCFLFIPFADSYVIVPPSDVKFRVYVCVAKVPNEVCN